MPVFLLFILNEFDFFRVKESPIPNEKSAAQTAEPNGASETTSDVLAAAAAAAQLRSELAAQERLVAELTGQKVSWEAELGQQRARATELESRLAKLQQDADCKVKSI